MIDGRLLLLAFALGSLILVGQAGAAPSGQAGSLTGATLPSGVALSDDDRYLAVSGKEGAGVLVWDTRAFSMGPSSATTCSPASGLVFAAGLTTPDRFYVGCERAQVHYVDLDPSTTPPRLTVSSAIELNQGSGDVVDLAFAEGDTYVHALVLDAGFMSIHRISIDQDSVTAVVPPQVVGGTPASLAIGDAGSPLVVPRSDGSLSWFDRSGDSYTAATVATLVSFGGALTSAAVSSDHGLVLVTDSAQSTLWSMAAVPGSASSPLATDLSGAQWVELAQEGTELLAWTAGSGTTVEVFDMAGTQRQSIDLVDSSAIACALASEAKATAYVAAADGSLRGLSDLPFIENLATSEAIVGGDESFVVSFSATQAGSWELRLGGDGVQSAGSSLATGMISEETPVSVELAASDLVEEGTNSLFVFVTSGAGTGVDSLEVVLDRPPGALQSFSLSAGDGRLVAEWVAGGETDLESFEVYLSDAWFVTEDGELPVFVVQTGAGEVSYPLSVPAGLPDETHSLEIEGLTNGQNYYLAVRALDTGGLLGPFSEVLSVSPAETCGAAECAGDEYGCSCSAAMGARKLPSKPWLWLVLLVLVIGHLRRQLAVRN